MVAPYLVLNEMIQSLTDEDASFGTISAHDQRAGVQGWQSNSQDKRHGLGRWLRMFLQLRSKNPLRRWNIPGLALARSREVIRQLVYHLKFRRTMILPSSYLSRNSKGFFLSSFLYAGPRIYCRDLPERNQNLWDFVTQAFLAMLVS